MNKLIIAKEGIDATATVNPNDFIFHSDYNTLKIISEGIQSFTLSASGTEQSFNFAHGLSYTPFVFAFCKFPGNRVGGVGSASNDIWFTNLGVSSTNITFYFFNETGTPTVYVKYYITEMPL